MTLERALRMMAGVVVLLSPALAFCVSQYWLLLTAFVGLNLLQSGITNWCPAMAIFRAMGLKEGNIGASGPITTDPEAAIFVLV